MSEDITQWDLVRLNELAIYAHSNTEGVVITGDGSDGCSLSDPPNPPHGQNSPEEMYHG